jgi:Na+/H+-translocating membrane pyrophosphatase
MYISIRANVRPASAARASLAQALVIAFRGGRLGGDGRGAQSLRGRWLVWNGPGDARDVGKLWIYSRRGVYDGKGSETHKAAVVRDTVGDPFKDTAGPSLHVLIKLLSTITLVVAPLFV